MGHDGRELDHGLLVRPDGGEDPEQKDEVDGRRPTVPRRASVGRLGRRVSVEGFGVGVIRHLHLYTDSVVGPRRRSEQLEEIAGGYGRLLGRPEADAQNGVTDEPGGSAKSTGDLVRECRDEDRHAPK